MHGVVIGFQILAMILIAPMYWTARPLIAAEPKDESDFNIESNVNTHNEVTKM